MRVFVRLQHSSILPILDVGVENGHPYVVSKYVSGGSLRQYLNRQSPSNITRGIQIISQVGSALRYAHARGILHGNIKPENIVFDEDGVALLMDFNFPVIQEKISAASSADARNVYYPETELVSQLSDQYALGNLAYEILTGHCSSVPSALLAAKELQLAEDILASTSSSFTQGLPRRIEAALRKATADKPDERFKNVATFINVLNVEPELFFDNTLSMSTPEIVASHANTGEETQDYSATIKIPQRRKYIPVSKRLICGALILFVALILSAFYLFQPALSSKSVDHSVPAQIDRTVPIPSVVSAGALPTSTVPTSTPQQQPAASQMPTMPLKVVSTPTSIPITAPPATPIPKATPTPVNNCAVSYVVTSQWSGGFTATIVISNTGSTAINGWDLVFVFPHGQRVTHGWNGSFSQHRSRVRITNLSYNSLLNGNSSTTLGFNGSWNGSNPQPASFILNGSPCNIG